MSEHDQTFTAAQLTKIARAVVEASDTAMAVVDEKLEFVASNEAFRKLVGDEEASIGASILALKNHAWDVADFRHALSHVIPDEQAFFDIPLPGGSPIYASGRILQTGDETPPPLIVLSFNREHAHAHTESVLANDPRLAQEIMSSVRQPMLVIDYDRVVRWANNAFCVAFRIDREEIESIDLNRVADGSFDIPALMARIASILHDNDAFEDLPLERNFPEIGDRAFLVSARRVDHLRAILITLLDVTDRRSDAKHTETLVTELAHRAKNLLAIVQSLAFQTTADTVEGFRTAFIGRAKALALAQGALIDTQWQYADLRSLVSELIAIQAPEIPDAISVSGPDVRLSPLQATTFALIINELATNAVAHGALSDPSGHLDVNWRRSAKTLTLQWREQGGPEVAEAPHSGFGTTLITRAATLQLGGNAELKFNREGLTCELEMALTDSD